MFVERKRIAAMVLAQFAVLANGGSRRAYMLDRNPI
jgi:hypothetical protein